MAALDYDETVSHLTQLVGQPVYVTIHLRQVGELLDLATVLEVPTGRGSRRLPGAPCDLVPETFVKADVRPHDGLGDVLTISLKGGVRVTVSARLSSDAWRRPLRLVDADD